MFIEIKFSILNQALFYFYFKLGGLLEKITDSLRFNLSRKSDLTASHIHKI